MATLPPYQSLRIADLAAVFNHTTNSYKFYWFWGLLELVQEGQKATISLDAVLIKMIALSWHTVAYYKVSLGSQDKLSEVVQRALALGDLQADSKVEVIEAYLWGCYKAAQPSAAQKALLNALIKLRAYVPYRFLRPFLGRLPKGSTERAIAERSSEVFGVAEEAAPYKITSPTTSQEEDPMLTIHAVWRDYLQQHYKILREFAWWNLCQYLRARNPNVPNISAKLLPPYTVQRQLKTAKLFWKIALQASAKPALYDIYSGNPLTPQMPIDHFIPWSFVLHDRLWNLAPTTTAFNSSKGNRLPHRDYWQPFARLQYQAFQRCYVGVKRPSALLEDYSWLFRASVDTVAQYTELQFVQKLQQQLEPLCQQAINSGFEAGWTAPEGL